MLVSIITVCYNSEATIRSTIESVLAQTYPNVEYIIMDGLSKDNTLSIAREYEDRFNEKGYKYRIISEKDNGIYDAMNKGIRAATGELVGLINSDDWYEPVAVETAATAYRETAYDMFYADINLIKEDGSVVTKVSKMDRFPTSRHWNHPTTFIPKKIYEEIGLYKCEGLHDDFELFLRLRKAGKKIEIRNIALANFRVGGVSNKKTWHDCVYRCKDRYRCYRSNGYSPVYFLECIAMELAKAILS